MPIGTIIGFLVGAFIVSAMVLLIEASKDLRSLDNRNIVNVEMAKHRCHYIFWCVTSITSLIGTFIEMGLS